MAKTKRRKTVNRWQVIFVLVVFALLITIALMVRSIFALHSERSELKEQETALENKRDELNAELKSVDDLEYIEEQARKLLRMIKPGEVLYVLNETDPRPQGDDDETEDEEKVPELPPVVQEPAYEESYEYEGTQDYTQEGTGETYGEGETGEIMQEEAYTQDATTEDAYSQDAIAEEGYTEVPQEEGYTEEYYGEEGTWDQTEEWTGDAG